MERDVIVKAFTPTGLPLVASAQLAAQGLAKQDLFGAVGFARALEDEFVLAQAPMSCGAVENVVFGVTL